jgi:hypothetical protein
VIECPYDQGFLNNWIRRWISSIVWELEQIILNSCKGSSFGIYYFTLPCFKVKYLPIKFIGNYLFEFPPIVQCASIDKRVRSFTINETKENLPRSLPTYLPTYPPWSLCRHCELNTFVQILKSRYENKKSYPLQPLPHATKMFDIIIIWPIVKFYSKVIKLCISSWRQMSGVVKFIMLFISKEISLFFDDKKCEKILIYKPPKWLYDLSTIDVIAYVNAFMHNKLFFLSI